MAKQYSGRELVLFYRGYNNIVEKYKEYWVLDPIHLWILGLFKPPFPCTLIESDSTRR